MRSSLRFKQMSAAVGACTLHRPSGSPQHAAVACTAAVHHALPLAQRSAAGSAEAHQPAAAAGHAIVLPAAATPHLHAAALNSCYSVHSAGQKKYNHIDYMQPRTT